MSSHVSDQLASKDVESLLPTYEKFARWSDRLHRSQSPLFPGYVFVHVSDTERVPVLRTIGVVNIVSVAGKPAPLEDADMERLRTCSAHANQVEPHPFLKSGQRVRVKHGPFAGWEGILIEKAKCGATGDHRRTNHEVRRHQHPRRGCRTSVPSEPCPKSFNTSTENDDFITEFHVEPVLPGSSFSGRRPVSMSEASSQLATRLEPFLGAVERGADFLTIIAAVYCSYALYRALGMGYQAQYPPSGVLASAAGLALLFVMLLERHGGYRRYLSLLGVRETEQVLRVTAECSLLALLVAYFAAIHVSRILVLITVTAVPAFLMLQKWEMYRTIRTLRSKGHGTRKAVIFGAGAMGRRIYSALLRSPKFGLDPVALLDEDPEKSGIEVLRVVLPEKAGGQGADGNANR